MKRLAAILFALLFFAPLATAEELPLLPLTLGELGLSAPATPEVPTLHYVVTSNSTAVVFPGDIEWTSVTANYIEKYPEQISLPFSVASGTWVINADMGLNMEALASVTAVCGEEGYCTVSGTTVFGCTLEVERGGAVFLYTYEAPRMVLSSVRTMRDGVTVWFDLSGETVTGYRYHRAGSAATPGFSAQGIPMHTIRSTWENGTEVLYELRNGEWYMTVASDWVYSEPCDEPALYTDSPDQFLPLYRLPGEVNGTGGVTKWERTFRLDALPADLSDLLTVPEVPGIRYTRTEEDGMLYISLQENPFFDQYSICTYDTADDYDLPASWNSARQCWQFPAEDVFGAPLTIEGFTLKGTQYAIFRDEDGHRQVYCNVDLLNDTYYYRFLLPTDEGLFLYFGDSSEVYFCRFLALADDGHAVFPMELYIGTDGAIHNVYFYPDEYTVVTASNAEILEVSQSLPDGRSITWTPDTGWICDAGEGAAAVSGPEGLALTELAPRFITAPFLPKPAIQTVLPADTVCIEAEAFRGTDVEHVICPDGLLTIGAAAFADCADLTSIELPASVTSIAVDAFSGSAQVTITAPAGSYAALWADEMGISLKTK